LARSAFGKVEEKHMTLKFLEMTPTHLSPDARKAVNEAFDAISTWRSETISDCEKNSEQVIGKMAAAARALGWPEKIIDATREQLQNITKVQIESLDRIMDIWEGQIKSPDLMTAPRAMLQKLKSFPSVGAPGGWPRTAASQPMAMNPMQLYAQFAQQWQKGWAEAMAFWTKIGTPHR
jgi:hypothetical protein